MEENATAATLLLPHLFLQPTNLTAVSLALATNTNIAEPVIASNSTRLDLQLPAAVSPFQLAAVPLFQLVLEAQPQPEFRLHLHHHQPPAQLATFTMAARQKGLEFALSALLHLHLI